MIDLRSRLSALHRTLDQLSVRERMLILAAILVALALLGELLVLGPLWAYRGRLAGDKARLTLQLAETTAAAEVWAAGAAADPDSDNRRRIATLKEEIAALDAGLRQKTAGLVEPAEMPGLLRQLLQQGNGLKLVALENLPPRPLVSTAGEGAEAANLYRHGLRLELEGSYLAVLAYVEGLERLPRRFFWDGLAFEVVGYPRARVVLTLYTLSLRQEWIGV